MRLLERESSLAMLDGCLAEAAAGQGSLVLVTGEAGFGKSALVRAFRAGPAARRLGARVWFGGCEALRTPARSARCGTSPGSPAATWRHWSPPRPPGTASSRRSSTC
jgi:hypothetical protein